MKTSSPIKTILAMALMGLALAATSVAKSKSSKVIDFDGDLVEGMNKRPLDSLSHISEHDKKKRKPHLYRKRAGFRTETAETLKVMRYSQ
jgi:hypothetical protein